MTIPRIIAHRGAMATEPENTLRSFVRAGAHGADELELDLRRTADGEVVVMHDRTVERTTDGRGEVHAMTLAQLRRLDAGHGERVPTIREVLSASGLPIQAEIKDEAAVAPFARIVAECGVAGRITVAATSAAILGTAAREMPHIPRALILGTTPADPADAVDQARAVDARWLALGLAGLTPRHVAACTEAGIAIDAWPVRTPEDMRRAVELGVEAVTADDPAAAVRARAEARRGHDQPVPAGDG